MNKEKYLSPWILQLKKSRKINMLKEDIETDITIVGAGIAGITTAYYLLKDTKKRVIIVEADKMCHGATGHNAGQIASYFEHSFSQIAKTYGIKKATFAQRMILGAWDLLDHIIYEVEPKHKPFSFTGFAGCSTLKQLLLHLENSYKRGQESLAMDFAYVKDDPSILSKIPKKYEHLYSVEPSSCIKKKLETNSNSYIAALAIRKGCLNSAKFCEEILEYMLKKYPERFCLYEKSPVLDISLRKHIEITVKNGFKVRSQKTVLCTNGFTNFVIKDHNGKEIRNTNYSNISGLVGYMQGYEAPVRQRPCAISYFPKDFEKTNAYYYLTRRPISKKASLICIGGPDFALSKGEKYKREFHYLENSKEKTTNFLKKNHKFTPNDIHLKYQWEGLMGYTKTKIRIIGKDPKHENLMYNLGCNGVGILPAIFGSKRISLIVQNKKLEPTIFDPK